ncbi:type II secretion system F family protein [Iamia majanohamensis]|uniref:Type II secretion system F family protein n=1 Tax=Iamia majanohamensis TaxID=467976 RepID=A0AAE9Y9I7_9ACTN|nr:type II secretion system F family protein [Iamia majanohamensis]WCO66839.1 type II secretion system F family protein [Iamia majanohamensis]
MPEFKYSAVGADGRAVKGTSEALSASVLENELLLQGHTAVQVRERKSFTQIEITKERVPTAEVMLFSRQLAAFTRTGIPLNEAIRIVADGVQSKRFQAILVEVEEAIQAGVPFSTAIGRHADVFPSYYVSILGSAELTGRLDIVLDQLATYIERDEEARSSVKSAMIYPSVILGMSIVVVAVMVLFVLPRFVEFFEDFDSELPLPTRMLLGFTDFVGTWWWAIALVLVLVMAGYVASGRTSRGRYLRHSVFLKVPLVGTIIEYSVIERFCRVIGAMMRAGVPLPVAMSAAIEGTSNEVFLRALEPAREEMIQGEGIAGPISRTGLFPVAAVQMIRVGEETGTLDEQMASAADFYSRELQYKLKRLTTVFEPAVIIFMGVVVGFVAVALISAMYGVYSGQDLDS